ncbi:hypothetical protein PNEG_02041 [Pneumocystis murina B123]|uniref:ATP-dependent DNA helicase PIF1 n=1 Tax=Pneumocystis murina (strain B123) TaxID=1069680 RepID=M7P7M8_PNEMU|nr:hypothetical protein PNEG_02041 [Pneumocystis murina B123]EMR09860.1 hypothetical protein PNEG_02041 [Pneumocystis murina B123]
MFQRSQEKHHQKIIYAPRSYISKISDFKQTKLQLMRNNITSNYIKSGPLKPVDASSLNIHPISVAHESSIFNDHNIKKNQKPSSSSIKFLETLNQQNKATGASIFLKNTSDENLIDDLHVNENDIDDNLNLDSEHDESFYSWSSSPMQYQHLALSGLKDQFSNECQSSDTIFQPKLSNTTLFEEVICETEVSNSLDSLEINSGNPKDLKNTALKENHCALQVDQKNEQFQDSGRILFLNKTEGPIELVKSEMKNRKRISSDILNKSDIHKIDNIQSFRFESKDIQKKSIKQKKNKKLPGLFLSEEQKTVLKIVVEERESIFFTGSAGTGKSVLLREIIASLRKKYAKEPDRVAITASTGLAACNIGGVTLHSYAGIGLGRDSSEDLCKKIRKNKKCLSRWLRTKVLIIDEISMVDAELFDKLENIARKIRNNENPFGGIQMIVTGDFFQLPPVPDQGKMSKFAFEAKKWKDVISHTIALTHVFRQKDQDFVEMLNELRLGRLSYNSINKFRSLDRELQFDDGLEPTELFPTRNEVDQANATRMRSLSGALRTFEALDSGTVDKIQRDKLLSNCMAPARIDLKEGAQVMLIKNFDDQLVNGSLGKVIGFMNEKTFQIWQEDEPDDDPFNYHEQIDDSNIDEIKKRKKRRIAGMQSAAATGKLWPLVRFTLSNGLTRDMLVQPEQWKIELPNGEVQASRSQIPLILAYAISIHKAQGQTLERVKVDLGRVFEKGQAYVALSRATSQKGLQVLHFEARKVMAHPKVSLFYKSLVNTGDLKRKANVDSDFNKEKNMDDFPKNYVG